MAFKWTKGEQLQANILDAYEFNREYNNHKDVLNGGLDRDNLPSTASAGGAMTATHLKQDAFLKYKVVDIQLPKDGTANNLHDVTLNYDEYGGGWRSHTATSISELFQEGMLHVELNLWYYLNVEYNQDNWCQFQVLVNNTVVTRSHRLYQTFGTIHLVGDVPIATGTSKVEMQYQFRAPGPSTSLNAMFSYNGGSLLALNRYR